MNMRKISIKEFKKRRFERSYISVYIVIRSISVENEQEIEVKNLCVIYGFTALGVRRIIAIYFENTNDNRFWLGVFEDLKSRTLEIQLKNLILAEDIEKCEENIELFKQQYLHNRLVLEVFKRQEDDIKKLYKYNYDIRKLLYQYYAIREIKRHINRLNERQPLQENIDDVIEHFTEYISSFERGLTYSKKGWVRLMNILYEIYPKKMEEYL